MSEQHVERGQVWLCGTEAGEWTPVEPYTHWSLGDNWTVRNAEGRVLYMTESSRKHVPGAWTLKPAPIDKDSK